jgi:hypothetical protein
MPNFGANARRRWGTRQQQRQKQIPSGDDNKKSNDNRYR